MDWLTVAIQAGGAIGTCGMFLWYLNKKHAADDKSRDKFLEHLEAKDEASQKAIDQQMQYLRERDVQSKEIAQSGHDALRQLTERVAELSVKVGQSRSKK